MEATSVMNLPLSLLLLLLISSVSSKSADDIKLSLIAFLRKLSPHNPHIDRDLGWTATTNPCLQRWRGISCNNRTQFLRSVVLESLDLDGSIDANLLSLLCSSSSLSVLSFKNNSITGDLPPEITGCYHLTHLYLSNNRLSGILPSSLSNLRNLKKIDISHNNFSGYLPWNLSKISGLLSFHADHNQFTGPIPEFDLGYFNQFNVSFNQLSGPVPLNSAGFPLSSFVGNSDLCGQPLPVACPPSPFPSKPKSDKISANKVVTILGYVLFGLVIVIFLVYKFLKKKKKITHPPKEELSETKASESSRKPMNPSQSEYSITSLAQSTAGVSTSLVVLKKDGSKELRFEELLSAPAELIGKGRFGSLYKVVIDSGAELAVKRIKDWTVSRKEFQRMMMRMDLARHPNVLPVTAFYCSKQEKLVVYEYQKNGSLFQLLHDNKEGRPFHWASRLNVAAGISAGLASMHQFLGGSGHGNLKSSNILLSSSMDPLISEYGLITVPGHPFGYKATADSAEAFSADADVYAFGIILLELLTGKPSHGFDLSQWVHSVVREEWTVEVFDRSLLAGGSGDERAEEEMVRLLQMALRCMSDSAEARPSMAEVAAMVAGMGEEDERSLVIDL